ncbi:MAG: hypothetical protein HKL95_10120 [Phycisphaerae bacterium]|nr:hypothetical protein [Phycisphaerae bacterium]
MAGQMFMDAQPMTSRQRVRRALRHQLPDRVPLDYSANAGIDAKLKAHFGLGPDDDEGLRQAIGVDFRAVHAAYTGRRLHPQMPGRHVDPIWGARTRWIDHTAGGYWDFCDFPLADATADAIANWPLPSPEDFDYQAVVQGCRQYPDKFIYLGGPGLVDVLNSYGFVRGVEQAMIDLADGYEAALRLIDRRLALWWEVTRRSLEAATGRIDLVWMGEDLGSQRGALISQAMFRDLLRPRHQRFIDLARSYDLPVMIHSCGSSSWAFDDFLEMGITAVDTLQPEAAQMSPAYLKSRFGQRLMFHGCISTAGPVALGTVEQTVEVVRETLETMMPGGGYCCSPTHMLQDNSPVENVLAMYETAQRLGVYT